ncbi:hypothetical protein BP5796_09546 [Coleophoma crateriformis]|uniref:Uncharacterized protein n=1 Tax=Coleophoma crateriformis TaxID=565419 RepID=A0A3D8QYF0_9HELO|nr:hypothetical protein BP5796_09546 [Coleophoma crateriformis]
MVDVLKRAIGGLLARDRPAQNLLASGSPRSHGTRTFNFNDDTAYQLPPIERATDPASPPVGSISKNTPFFEEQYTQVRGDNDDYPGKPINAKAGWLTGNIWDGWTREIFSILFSLASLVAIVIVLARHNEKPAKNWSVGISLNTYLALFTTLAKAGMIFSVANCIGQLKWVWFSIRNAPLNDFAKFDDATRGPLDSLLLLWRLKFMHTASVGALITVLAIAISPLSQQTIAYPIRLVESSASPAQLPTSNWWGGTTGQSSHTDIYSAVLSFPMKQAISDALYTQGTNYISAIAPTCPSGNCTWPEYQSLGVCSRVSNISHLLNETTVGDGQMGPTIMNLTLPNDAYLEYGVYKTNISSGLAITYTPGQQLGLLTDNTTIGPLILDAYIIYERDGANFLEVNSTNPAYEFDALEILLYWCVNAYQTTVNLGLATTTVSNSSTKVTYQSENIYDNITIAAPTGTAEYNVTGTSNAVLSQYLTDIFQGEYAGAFPNSIGGSTTDLALIIQKLIEPSVQNAELPAAVNTPAQVLNGVTNYTQNMAISMTNSVRTYIGYGLTTQSIYVDGQSFAVETFVHVRWRWLTLLFGLVAASVVFLIGTVLTTSRYRVDAMKSNALAAVTVLSHDARTYMGPADLRDDMSKKADGLMLRLNKGEKGWDLKRVE